MMQRSLTLALACAQVVLTIALICATSAPSVTTDVAQRSESTSAPWAVIGPGGGGAQFFPAISPHDSGTVLVACDMTGAYVTHDAGHTWRMFNLRAPVHFFVFDPQNANRLYAGADGLWRSEDAGKTWKIVFPPAESVSGLAMPDDHASVRLVTGDKAAADAIAFAVDPVDSSHVYLVAAERGTQRTETGGTQLLESTDGGAKWNKTADLPQGVQHVYVEPREHRLFISGRGGLSMARGGRWSTVSAPSGVTFTDTSGGFTQEGEFIAYGITGRAVFVFRGAGNEGSWTALHLPGADAKLRAIASSAGHAEVVYVSYGELKADGKRWFGVAKSTDAGNTWQLVWKETAAAAAANVHDAWITPLFGPGWGENPLSLGVSPPNPDIAYGTDFGRTLRTEDGGANWTAMYSRRVGAAWTTTGLDVTTNYGIFFDPSNHRRQFIAYTDIGLMRSDDGGASWQGSGAGIPRKWQNTTYWLVFDPNSPQRMWSAVSATHDLPRPKMWRHASSDSYQGGVVFSSDGGRSWSPRNAGMQETAVTHLLLVQSQGATQSTLFATGFGRGVFKSSDGGLHWQLKNNGIGESQPFAWRLADDLHGVLYLIVARRTEDGSYGNSGDGALYRSSDGAEHWSKLTLPAGVNGPNGLAIDPRDARRLYLAAWARNVGVHGEGGGVFLSTDGGAHWSNILSGDQHVYDVTIDPRNPDVLYACGFESSAWRSADRGQTWQRIRGYNFKWGHRVIIDPDDAGKIYVTTFGGSVWHGPAQGDPNAFEDIATSELRYESQSVKR
jgi:photosystem II stability/assembly factor-like uncharacterized protein